MGDNLLNNPARLKYLWKSRGKKNYDLKSFIYNGTVIQHLVLEDIRDNRKLLGKLVKYPKEGESYHWPRLQHENLAPLLDIVSINEEISIFISPVIGRNLQIVIHDREFMFDPECYNRKKAYAEDILWALDYLHEKSLCIMNLTDLVVCICEVFDVAMICDFSCVCLIERVNKYKVDLPVLYQAPELKDEYFDPLPAESWACGVLFLQTFTAHCLPATAIGDKVRQVIEAVHEMNYDIIKEANPGAQIDVSVINDLREFLNLFLVEHPNCRADIRSAAVHHFFWNSRKSRINNYRFSQSNNQSEHPWNINKSKSVHSRFKHPKNSSTFKDIYMKEAENLRNKFKKPPCAKVLHPKFINLDFVTDGDPISKYPEDNQRNTTGVVNGKKTDWDIEKSILEKAHPSETDQDSNRSMINNYEQLSRCTKTVENERNVYYAANDNKSDWNIKMSVLEYVHSSNLEPNSSKSVFGNNEKSSQHVERGINNAENNNKIEWNIEKAILDHVHFSEIEQDSSKPANGNNDKVFRLSTNIENKSEINNVSNNSRGDWKKEKSISDNAHPSETVQDSYKSVIANNEKVFQNCKSIEKGQNKNDVANGNKNDCNTEQSLLQPVRSLQMEQEPSKPITGIENEREEIHLENGRSDSMKEKSILKDVHLSEIEQNPCKSIIEIVNAHNGNNPENGRSDFMIEKSTLKNTHPSETKEESIKSMIWIENNSNGNDVENDKDDCKTEKSILKNAHLNEAEKESSKLMIRIENGYNENDVEKDKRYYTKENSVLKNAHSSETEKALNKTFSNNEHFFQPSENIEDEHNVYYIANDNKNGCKIQQSLLEPIHNFEIEQDSSKSTIGSRNGRYRNGVVNGNKNYYEAETSLSEQVHTCETEQDSSKLVIGDNAKFFQHSEGIENGSRRNDVASGSNTEKSVLKPAHHSESEQDSRKPVIDVENEYKRKDVVNDNKGDCNTKESLLEPTYHSESERDSGKPVIDVENEHKRKDVVNDNKSDCNTKESLLEPTYHSESERDSGKPVIDAENDHKRKDVVNDNKSDCNTEKSVTEPAHSSEVHQGSNNLIIGKNEKVFQNSENIEIRHNRNDVANHKSYLDKGKSILESVHPSNTEHELSKSMIGNNEKLFHHSESIEIKRNRSDISNDNKSNSNIEKFISEPVRHSEMEQESSKSTIGNNESFQCSKNLQNEQNINDRNFYLQIFLANDNGRDCNIEGQQGTPEDSINLHNHPAYENGSFSMADDLQSIDNTDGGKTTPNPPKKFSSEDKIKGLKKELSITATVETQMQSNCELYDKYLEHKSAEQQQENRNDASVKEDNLKIRKKKSFLKFAFSSNKKSNSVAKEKLEINRRHKAKENECILSAKDLIAGSPSVFYTQNSVYIEDYSVDDTTEFAGKRKKKRINWMKYLCPGSVRKANR